jgi:3-oxoacyl-[acyl-carrier protein] reductase
MLIDSDIVQMNSNRELAGRVAIVTGAGRNIGREIARSLAVGGAAVTVNVRSNRDEADSVAREIILAGREALAFVADVSDPQMVQKMVVATAEHFGRIDILVNNAAVRAEQALSEMTLEQWRAVIAVILDGAFNCVKACLPYLQKSGGVIVNIGGLSAHTGAKRRPHVVTAKAGLIGFTRALAHELADDKIRVNMVSPGLMGIPRPNGADQPQHESLVDTLVGRRGVPDDIATIVRFLCSPGASYITGQNILVNGGAFLG